MIFPSLESSCTSKSLTFFLRLFISFSDSSSCVVDILHNPKSLTNWMGKKWCQFQIRFNTWILFLAVSSLRSCWLNSNYSCCVFFSLSNVVIFVCSKVFSFIWMSRKIHNCLSDSQSNSLIFELDSFFSLFNSSSNSLTLFSRTFLRISLFYLSCTQ